MPPGNEVDLTCHSLAGLLQHNSQSLEDKENVIVINVD